MHKMLLREHKVPLPTILGYTHTHILRTCTHILHNYYMNTTVTGTGSNDLINTGLL